MLEGVMMRSRRESGWLSFTLWFLVAILVSSFGEAGLSWGGGLPSEIVGKDGAPMVLIPAGPFPMGVPKWARDGGVDERPNHEVDLDAFYMDKYEVTNGRYLEFIHATGHRPPKHRTDQTKNLWQGGLMPESIAPLPVINVDWFDAQAYCEWAGKRLPTEAEWEKAAKGTDDRRFPWGDVEPTNKHLNFNHTFRDNYLDLHFDLSKIMFITTGNTLDPISRPLMDRMEILRLPGYSQQEKYEIAIRYLWPRRLKEAGLTPDQISMEEGLLTHIITSYTKEAGVRQLEQMLGRLTRKVALKLADSGDSSPDPIVIQQAELMDWLGTDRFLPDESRRELPIGVATGLAWTEAGGEVLYVETTLLPGGSDLTLTGQLGEVMQESAQAARSYLWSRAEQMGLNTHVFKRNGLHIHIPEGAIPKDGPSAGVTMVTALASTFLKARVRSDTAMTGEISLSGLVLPVGGIKEKVLGAHRAGIKQMILPKGNEKDLKEVPDQVRNDLTFVFVETLDEVLAATLLTNNGGPHFPIQGSPQAQDVLCPN